MFESKIEEICDEYVEEMKLESSETIVNTSKPSFAEVVGNARYVSPQSGSYALGFDLRKSKPDFKDGSARRTEEEELMFEAIISSGVSFGQLTLDQINLFETDELTEYLRVQRSRSAEKLLARGKYLVLRECSPKALTFKDERFSTLLKKCCAILRSVMPDDVKSKIHLDSEITRIYKAQEGTCNQYMVVFTELAGKHSWI